jgi:hypothetical protein
MTDAPDGRQAPDQEPDVLVNSETIARKVVEAGLAAHMTGQRIRQLAAPAEQGGDPDWPEAVPSVGRGRWYWWSEVRRYFEQRTVSRVPRRYRLAPPATDPQPPAGEDQPLTGESR